MLKRTWNLIYYRTEQITTTYANNWGKIEEYLVGFSPTVQHAEHMMDNPALTIKARQYDSRSWYYAMRAESEYESGKKPEACKNIKLAEESIEKCFEHWHKNEITEYDASTAWRLHYIKIKSLKEKIGC